MNISTVLKTFGIDNYEMSPLGNGLINKTWLVREISSGNDFVFQRINEKIFKRPEDITSNIRLIDDYLKKEHPHYHFTSPVVALNGEDMIKTEDNDHFRLFGYVGGSVTHIELTKPVQAYEAAKQFGKFTNLLSGLDLSQLKTTIPDFHNLGLRFQQFMDSLKCADQLRLKNAREVVNFLMDNQSIADEYRTIITSSDFKLRVTHHDTKISNVLFDLEDKGLCVIDLDTVMPGYFISDLGDMMRTYLSPVSEEEGDLSKIEVRTEFFQAIVHGYLSEMGDELSQAERSSITYSGKFMIYMQALRFITDYLNNDFYYGARYEGHNLVRGKNQVKLLQLFLNKESLFDRVVFSEFNRLKINIL